MRDDRRLRVLLATPLGKGGRGGIDRLNDAILDVLAAEPDGSFAVERLVTRGQGNLLHGQFVFARALWQLFRAARRGQVDLLHICLAIRGSAYRKTFLAACARRLRVPYLVHVHGGNFEQFWSGTNSRLRRALDRMFLGSAGIIVLAKSYERIFTDRLPPTAGRIIVLPNASGAADAEQEGAADGRVRITFLGEVGRRKGTPQLVEALGRLKGRTDWTATIAGNGDVDATRARVEQLGIAERVEVPGWLGPAATADLLRRTDVFVLPSTSENLPMSIIEAFAHGIAVIATPVGCVGELVEDGRNGLLVPVGNVEVLTDAIRRLIENPALRLSLGQAAREDHAARYEIHGYVRRLVDIWKDSVAGRSMIASGTARVPD